MIKKISFHPFEDIPPQKNRVMIIDDSPTVRKIVEICLGREGFNVVSFPDGVEAMRWLTEPDSYIPDLVLLDIELPKLDGYEVARRLRAKTQFCNTVFVILSRRDSLVDKLKGRLAGARDYITKPFKHQDLIAVTRMYLGDPPPKPSPYMSEPLDDCVATNRRDT